MSDNAASQPAGPPPPATIAELVRRLEPMGDLGGFTLDDMTVEEEDAFFRILDEA